MNETVAALYTTDRVCSTLLTEQKSREENFLQPIIFLHDVQLNVQYTLVPTSYPSLSLTGTPYPSDLPPNITDSICRYSGTLPLTLKSLNLAMLSSRFVAVSCWTMQCVKRAAGSHTKPLLLGGVFAPFPSQ
jgi:hypothetical protein